MKKFIFITCLLLIISGCSHTTSTHTIVQDSSLSGIHDISYQELNKKMKEKDTFVLYIGRPDCQDCQEFSPIIEQYLQKHPGVYLYYFNTKAYRDQANQSKEGKQFYNQLRKKLDFSWTPTLKFIVNEKNETTYTYLDEEYYSLDSNKQKQEKEKYKQQFYKWMNKIFIEGD